MPSAAYMPIYELLAVWWCAGVNGR
jgi:hypothetical protein